MIRGGKGQSVHTQKKSEPFPPASSATSLIGVIFFAGLESVAGVSLLFCLLSLFCFVVELLNAAAETKGQ